MANRGNDDSEKDVVPESILSVSKDVRYIQQCSDLLQRSLAVLLERKESSDPERKLELQRVRKQMIWMISCSLYLLVSTTTGRTIGMEALGLKFATDNTISNATTRLRRFRVVFVSLLSVATCGLVSGYFFTDKESAKSDGDGDGDGGNQQHRERSRGRERRLIHERLRRQMLERAANLDGTSTTPSIDTSDQQSQGQVGFGSDNTTRPRRFTSPFSSEWFLTIFSDMSKFIFNVCSNSDGPHDIIQGIDTDNENNGGDTRSISHSIALWIVRLHLVHFLLTGKYPTLLHRIFGLKPRREESITDATSKAKPRITILDRPTTNRGIAVIILLQVVTSVVRKSSNWFAEKIAKYLEARASKERTKKNQKTNAQLTRARLRKNLDTIFGNNSPEFEEKHTISEGNVDSLKGDKKTTILCTICRLERKHPACPTSCGHVCCWNCLIQWVSTVRPECPICRAPCNPKDVLPLHNYEPVISSNLR